MAPKKEPAKKTQSMRKTQPAKKAKKALNTKLAKKKTPPKKKPVTTTKPAKKKKPPKKALVTTKQPPTKKKVAKKAPAATTQRAKKKKVTKKAPAATKPPPVKKPKKLEKNRQKKNTEKITITQKKEPKKKMTPSKKKEEKGKTTPSKKKEEKGKTTPSKKKEEKGKTTPSKKKEEKGKTTPSKKKEEKGKTTPAKKKEEKGKTTPAEKKPNTKVTHNLDKSFFCVLRDYGSYVKKPDEKKYPWIARVIHSKTKDFPHKCTASCIDPRLFVTAARCITILVVEYTHVKYAGVRMPVLAFVVPSSPTKQMFDDIGIIVVEATSYKGPWPKISLTNTKRTDNDYEWFDKLQLEKAEFGTHLVVGYAKEKLNPQDTVYTEFKLSTLKVTVGMSLCYKILREKQPTSPDYWVPCYHSCTVEAHYQNNTKCLKYLGAVGSAVIDSKSNTLIGVATWGTRFVQAMPPVGFAIPNSKNFIEDLACAKKVLQNNGATADMQSLCPLPKKKP